MMQNSIEHNSKPWLNPSQVMKMQKLKSKKKALQARLKGTVIVHPSNTIPTIINKSDAFEDVLTAKKRKNPFITNIDAKRIKPETNNINAFEGTTDNTLFKLLHPNENNQIPLNARTSFKNILNTTTNDNETEIVSKEMGESWFPIDWALKYKMRLWSKRPFPWNQKLKISEEASGITGFVRCLDNNNSTTLDTAPNARFHQCCLYWQHPSMPWLTLFPRTTSKNKSNNTNIIVNSDVKAALQAAWADSFRSLFQLLRTKQCPFFYICANTFTVLFRAAGICGFQDVHVLITPTTRGFRKLLKQDDIEFTLPLHKRNIDGSPILDRMDDNEKSRMVEDEDDEVVDENWLKEMGINAEDIKQINFTQEKMKQKAECRVDNSDESLVLVEGVEVNGVFNFLLNFKNIAPLSGPLAGVPPTILAPVSFNGATLCALKLQESKIRADKNDFYSLEVTGPILPNAVHSMFAVKLDEHSISATFNNLHSTMAFSHVKSGYLAKNSNFIFDKENLSDCGLNKVVLEKFCRADDKFISNIECLKYNCDSKTYTWTT